MTRFVLANLGMVLAGLALGSSASAATVNYPSCTGTTVQYTNISESSANAPLYNQPDCIGNLLDFDPTGFEANSNPPTNPDLIDGNLLFTVGALQTSSIDNLILGENGDWQVFGFEPGSNSLVSVTLTVRLEIIIATSGGGSLEVEYGRRTPLQFTTASTSPNSNIWSIHEEFPMTVILADACTGTGFFHPITGGLTGAGGTGPIAGACGATTANVGVNIDNTLLAYAQNGEFSFINKKDFDGLTVTSQTDPIPEPAPAALLALGLVAVAAARRR